MSDIVLPSLSNWTESHITAIYNASSQADTSNAIDNFLSKHAVIVVNGKKIHRADFIKELQSEKFLEVVASVKFLGIVEVPANEAKPVEAGSVGTFFNVTIEESILVRDAALSHIVTASLNVVINQELSLPIPLPPPIHGFSDRRRVTELNLVITDKQVPFGPLKGSSG